MPLKANKLVRHSAPMASYLIFCANCIIFAILFIEIGGLQFKASAMLAWGATSNDTIMQHEYWRLFAASFLHFNILHLTGNMIWLMAWGTVLERRVGSTYYLIIYLAAALAGNVASVLGHHTPVVAAGASGAISGIAGALLCLQVLGKGAMSPRSLIANLVADIGLNFMQAATIDWIGHLGGFAAGMAVCAVLDLVEHLNSRWLRCKFPEFVKLNLAIAIPLAAWSMRDDVPADMQLTLLAAGLAAALVAVKLLDLLMARRKGLALAIVVLVAANMLLAYDLAKPLLDRSLTLCARYVPEWRGMPPWLAEYVDSLCGHPGFGLMAFCAIIGISTILAFFPDLRRGIADVGFIAERMRADRRRFAGL